MIPKRMPRVYTRSEPPRARQLPLLESCLIQATFLFEIVPEPAPPQSFPLGCSICHYVPASTHQHGWLCDDCDAIIGPEPLQ